jgi:hypothetical protein
MPSLAVQKNASGPREEVLQPMMIEPSAETAFAPPLYSAPSKLPMPTRPPDGVQRNGSGPFSDVLMPTTARPSAETPVARLFGRPPLSCPRPMKNPLPAGSAADIGAATSTLTAKATMINRGEKQQRPRLNRRARRERRER